MHTKLDILAFAAHPDDVELSCSGTLLKMMDLGKTAGIIDLTRGELGTRGTPELRQKEAEAASAILGISVRENLGLEDGFFADNKESQMLVIEMIRKYRPDVILANAIDDRHIDHGRAARLVHHAAFLSGLSKIETPGLSAWRPKRILHYIQDYSMKPSLLVDITPYFSKKLECIRAFSSQFYDPDSKEPVTPISGSEFFAFLEARSREMGRLAGVHYAEGFVSQTPLVVGDITGV